MEICGNKQVIPENDFGKSQQASPQWVDLRSWLELVARTGQLKTIAQCADPNEELAAITYMATRSVGSPALLFESFPENPYSARVLSNMLGSSKERYALTVGMNPHASMRDLIEQTRSVVKRRIAPTMIDRGAAPVNEIVLKGDEIDLTRLPIPKFWPADGGPFIGTGSVTLTKSPSTGRVNVGIYRQQLFGPRRIGLNFVPGRHGEHDVQAAWALGRPAEVVVAFGVDPLLFIVGSQRFGAGESELDAAGGIMGRPVELAMAETVDVLMPARAEMVIEGIVRQGDGEIEGPLGEFHGFYSEAPTRKPVIDVTAVRFRKSPIMTAALMALYPSGEIGAYQTIMRSARILDDLDNIQCPGVKGVYCHPAAASGNCLVVVSLKQMYPGHASQALALTAQCPAATYYTKWIVAVDDDVDPTDIDEVIWALSARCNPSEDIDFLRQTMSFRADPSIAPQDKPYGSKILINACTPYRYRQQAPVRTLLRRSVYDSVAKRWNELGFSGVAPSLSEFYDERKKEL
ncbi:MAG: UbiD family decarboxylase [Nitrospira sp.]|nr:UbiD family decarboxylase [Nitrospira sp.]